MKKWIVPWLAALAVISSACAFNFNNDAGVVVGSGRLVDKQFAYTDFTRVEVGFGARAALVQGSAYATTVTIDDNAVENLIVEQRGDLLYIGLKGGSYRNVTLRVHITMPALAGLTLSGGARATLTGFRSSSDFTLNASGGSNLSGDLEAGDVNLTLSGGSQLTLKGAGKRLTLNASGGSPVDLTDFVSAGDARVVLSGGSRANIHLKGRLDADLSGGAQLRYKGSPTLGQIHSSGGSQISSH